MQNLFRIVFVLALTFLFFVWGVIATQWNIFPHHYIVRLRAGFDAMQKMEDASRPQHVIGLAPEAGGIDPVQTFVPQVPDDLILMTGGFFYRQDQCPAFGCMAFVMDRAGTVLHRWEYDPAALFTREDFKSFTGYPDPVNLNVQGVDIDRDGNLIVIFQGRNVFPYQVGIAKFSWDSRLIWIRIDNSHHWPKVGPDNRIYSPVARITRDQKTVAATREPLNCPFGAVFQDGIRILSPEGEVLREFWLEDVVKASDLQGLAYAVRSDCDPYHVNGIDLLNAAAAAALPGTRAGDLLVSLRSSSSLVVMDQDDGAIKQVIIGPMVAQHSPQVLPGGDLVVFDNLGHQSPLSGSRVLRISLPSRQGETAFPRDPAGPGSDFYSLAQGAIELSSDGSRVLASETLGGRVFEADMATGKTLWQYDSISDLGPYLKQKSESADTPVLARMQTQGAAYVERADFARWSGGN